jgi:UDP-3-O-[3-hydroxymyristoyl] glucosamine N-acyltransferase
MEWSIDEILVDISKSEKYFVEGNKNKKIMSVSSLANADNKDLAFYVDIADKNFKKINESKAGIILCRKDLRGAIHPQSDSTFIFVDNPRLAFVKFVKKMQAKEISQRHSPSISPTAIIAKNVTVGKNCHIGDYVTIGKECSVNDNTIISARVTLSQKCRIGENCIIQSGVTLGEDGFSYERLENGELEKFPHLKGVIIGNDVEICANSNIARGSLIDTVVGDGTKIDAMVHIAHNVNIGRNCQITAGTIIGGSVVIGNSCWLGLNCTIKNSIKIGNNVIVGAGACVIRDVPDGDVVAGIPAKSILDKVSTREIFLMSGQRDLKNQVREKEHAD